METVYIAVWRGDDGELEAQAYTTRVAAERDFGPDSMTAIASIVGGVKIIESTVQS